MAPPFMLGLWQRPINCLLKLRPLMCFVKPTNPYIGGFLVHNSCTSIATVDNASELCPTASGLRGPQQNNFECQQHGVLGRWNCSVWCRGELSQTDNMHTLRPYYWMVQTRSFKTKRSGGQTPNTPYEITDECSQWHPPASVGDSGSSLADNSAWMLRFSNDNTFASFCRNAYLSVVVAFTVVLDQTPVIFAREVSMLFLVIGFTQLVYGTVGFMYATVYLRKQMHMSRIGAFGICSMALLHLLLWIVAVTIFLSVGGDDDDCNCDYQVLEDIDNNRVSKSKKE